MEGDKEAGPCPLIRLFQLQQRHIIQRDRTGGDVVIRMPGHDLRERAFAGSVFAHDGMDFAFRDFEVEAAENFAFSDICVEVLDVE